jgi:hypothetical protein
VESCSIESIPPPVVVAAAARGLGGPVTRASTDRLTPTRSYLLVATALMSSFLSSVVIHSLGLPTGLLGPIVAIVVLGCVGRAGWLLLAVGELTVPWTEVTGMRAGRDYLQLDGVPASRCRCRATGPRTSGR